ncbi:uncharacterized protein METZ01_LOCUS364038, partial [marine metagenome]
MTYTLWTLEDGGESLWIASIKGEQMGGGREGQTTEQPGLSPLNSVVQAIGEVERQRELEMDGYYDSKEKLADG